MPSAMLCRTFRLLWSSEIVGTLMADMTPVELLREISFLFDRQIPASPRALDRLSPISGQGIDSLPGIPIMQLLARCLRP